MKRIGIIEKISPFVEKEYKDGDGNQSLFVKLGIVVATGGQTVYVEFKQDSARAVRDKIVEGQIVQVEYDCKVREYTDKNNETRFENVMSGRALQIFSDKAF